MTKPTIPGAVSGDDPVRAEAGGRTCTISGCDRPHYGKDLCQAHHQRQVRTGTPGPAQIAPRTPREALCTVAACGAPHKARGYCETHYARWRRTGDAHPDTPPNPRTCATPGCPQRHYAQGLCRAHYRRWKEAGGARPTLDIAEAAQLYRDGASAAGLGRRYGRTPHTILTALRAAGVTIRPPGRHKPAPNP